MCGGCSVACAGLVCGAWLGGVFISGFGVCMGICIWCCTGGFGTCMGVAGIVCAGLVCGSWVCSWV